MNKYLLSIVLFLLVSSLKGQEWEDVGNDSTVYCYCTRTEVTREECDQCELVNWKTWFMPGLGYCVYQPKLSDSLGVFSGLTIEYLIYGQVHKNDKPGPSHVRFYGKLNILPSSKEDVNSMFLYTLGLDLSLEKNPKRDYLVPYFGLEFGGISQKQLGTTAQFTPTLGVHIVSKRNLFINIQAGYLYPFNDFEERQGWMLQAGANFALW